MAGSKNTGAASGADGDQAPRRRRRNAGGAATGAGMNYQAAVTAIAGAHLIKGAPMSWLGGLTDDVPVAVWAESGGAGDDIRLELQSGTVVEIQVKKGLRIGEELWSALLSLARAVSTDTIGFGVLVISPSSSRSIAHELATDIRHLADGRTDSLSASGEAWHDKLVDAGIPVVEACGKLRIHVVHAVESDDVAIVAVKALLASVYPERKSIEAVWEALYREAHSIIERRGRWTVRSVRNLLAASGVATASGASPIQVAASICDWARETNRGFSILGVRTELPIDSAWIPLKAMVIDIRNQDAGDVANALTRYHEKRTRAAGAGSRDLDAQWIGRFYTRAVVVAGPGMGKSTLLTMLARLYAADAYPVLKVRLSAVAARMTAGHSFIDSALHLGLSGSSVTMQTARESGLRDWVLLCDGLDECHTGQEVVAEGIRQFAVGHPHVRIVVTTRPIGYHTACLSEWRHYELLAPEMSAGPAHLGNLLRAVLPTTSSMTANVDEVATKSLLQGVGEAISWSPHMLGMAASLLARGGRLGATKAELYGNLFGLVDSVPSPRVVDPGVSKPILLSVLNTLGWEIMGDPLASVDHIRQRCAARLQGALCIPALRAQEIAALSVKYWEDVGLIERLYHGQADLLAFIHKTFAEFAAAKFLCSDVPGEERACLLEERIGKDDWAEVISFVGGLGCGQDVVSAFLKNVSIGHAGSMQQVLRIIAMSGEAFEAETRRQVLERAWSISDAAEADVVYAIGDPLAEVAKAYPAQVGPEAASRLSSPQPWTRLVAWLCAAEAGSAYYQLRDATEALRFVSAEVEPLGGSLLGNMVLRQRTGGVELVQKLALKIAERLKIEGAAEDIDAFLAVVDRPTFDTTSFRQRLSKTLGIPDKTFKNLAKRIASSFEWAMKQTGPDKYSRAERVAMEVLVGTLAAPARGIAAEDLDGKIPLQLSAFIDLTGFGQTAYSDILAWSKPFDMEMAQEVVRSLANVSGLDNVALQNEAASVLKLMQESDSDQFWWRIFMTANVDVPEPDWTRIRFVGADRSLLLKAVLHRSSWMMVVATNLVEGFGPIAENEAEFLLRNANGHGFAGAAYLAGALGERGIKLLLDRINGPHARGLEHVFEKLQQMDAPWSDAMHGSIQIGLLSKDVVAAKSAAKLALSFTRSGASVPAELLEAAYDHWLVHEEPYPQGSGVIPDSPRSALLEGMCLIGGCADGRLVEALADPRSDVKEVAVKETVERMRSSERTGAYVVDKAIQKTISAQGLNTLLSKHAAISQSNVDRLKVMLEDDDPKYRRAACGLLDPRYLGVDEIEMIVTRMLEDPEREIRELARRVLKRFKAEMQN